MKVDAHEFLSFLWCRSYLERSMQEVEEMACAVCQNPKCQGEYKITSEDCFKYIKEMGDVWEQSVMDDWEDWQQNHVAVLR